MTTCQSIAPPPDLLSEIESEAHEETLDRIYQFDFMTAHGFKLNFLTGVFE